MGAVRFIERKESFGEGTLRPIATHHTSVKGTKYTQFMPCQTVVSEKLCRVIEGTYPAVLLTPREVKLMQATTEEWLQYVETAFSPATHEGYAKIIRRFVRN